MTLQFETWTHPDTGELRVYIITRFTSEKRVVWADGAYFTAGKNGEIRPHYVASDRTDEVTKAIAEVMEIYRLNCSFAEFVDRLKRARTKAGNFSETRYFMHLYRPRHH